MTFMLAGCGNYSKASKIAKFMGPTLGPPGSCRPQMSPMLAPWTLLSGLAGYIDSFKWKLVKRGLYALDSFIEIISHDVNIALRIMAWISNYILYDNIMHHSSMPLTSIAVEFRALMLSNYFHGDWGWQYSKYDTFRTLVILYQLVTIE